MYNINLPELYIVHLLSINCRGEFALLGLKVTPAWAVLHASLHSCTMYLLCAEVTTPLFCPPTVFLTGSDRIPIHGMASLRIVLQSTATEEHYLPVAHTCYNMLDMPCYQTKETLRRRLTQAVEQYEGFSLV